MGIREISQADTYIEEVFEQKCWKKISEGEMLLNEWRIRKGKYMDLGRTVVFDFLHYSRHDASHSINILNSIELVLGKKRIRKLSTSDLWLLLECAYYHDLAMSVSYDEVSHLWKKDKSFREFCAEAKNDTNSDVRDAALNYQKIDSKLRNSKNWKTGDSAAAAKEMGSDWPVTLQRDVMILTSEYLRKKHASDARRGLRRVLQNIQDVSTPVNAKTAADNSVIKRRLNQLVETVSALHGEDFPAIEKELPQKTRAFSTENVHPQFVAAMLRLGDLLDMDNNRFDPMAMRRFGDLPYTSRLHYEKHEAITHFVIDTHAIGAKAYSEDYDVCQTVSDWFQQLEKEVQNLICAWNRFAPRKLRGCTLAKCDLNVYYRDALFDTTKQKRFEVDKEKLIDLVIGSNVYDSRLDCIREYIQNALDASKMKLWMDIKNGAVKRTGSGEITPYDIPADFYAQLQIEVRVGVNADSQSVKIQIIDNGIGMEQECIDSLSVIGSGWKSRNLYKNETARMPEWLRPTGGFGIGLQSVFMLSDKLEIRTRSATEPLGHALTLCSPRMKRPVAQHDCEKYSVGTEMEFEFSLMDFYALVRQEPDLRLTEKKEFALELPDKLDNAFNQKNAEKYIKKYLQYYLKKTFPDTLFPIRIICDGRDSVLIKNWYAGNAGSFSDREYSWDGTPGLRQWDKKCSYFITEDLTVRIWDQERNVFACITIWPNMIHVEDKNRNIREPKMAEKSLLNAICYKNARVGHPNCSDDYLNYFDFLTVCIDFMGWDISDVMPIQRDSFMQGIDVMAYYREYVALALRMIHKEHLRAQERAQKEKLNISLLPVFYYLLAVIQLLEKEETAEIMESFRGQVHEPDTILVKKIDKNQVVKDQIKTEEALDKLTAIFQQDTGKRQSTKSVFVTAQEVIQENKIMQFSMDLPEKAQGIPQLEEAKTIIQELGEAGIIYDNKPVCNALLHLGSRLDKKYFRITSEECPDGVFPTYVRITDLDGGNLEFMPQEIIDHREFLRMCFQAEGGRYIAKNISTGKKDFERLKVSVLPGQKQDETETRKNRYFISPVSRATYLRLLQDLEVEETDVNLKAEIDAKSEAEKDANRKAVKGAKPEESPKIHAQKTLSLKLFIRRVKKDKWYAGITSWVKKYQITESGREPLDEKKIDALYCDLLEEIYETFLDMGAK